MHLDAGDPYAKGLTETKAPIAPESITDPRELGPVEWGDEIHRTLPRIWRDDTGHARAVLRTSKNETIADEVLTALDSAEVEQLAAWVDAVEAAVKR